MAKKLDVTSENRKEVFKDLYDDWAITIEGLDPTDADDLVEIIEHESKGLKEDAVLVHYTGKDMNEFFELKKDPYNDDLNCFAICKRYLNDVNALALSSLIRHEIGMRWFTDIVDNNAHYEGNAALVLATLR
jgi:hypothetical protein